MNPNNMQSPEAQQPENPGSAMPQSGMPPTPAGPGVVTSMGPSPKPKGRLAMILLVVLLLLVAGGAVYWFVLRGKGATKTANTSTSQNTATSKTDDTSALAALRADSDAAGLTATSAADTAVVSAYKYYDKNGASIAMMPALALAFKGYNDAEYAANVTKIEQLMTENGLKLVHGDMAASTWQGASGTTAYVTYAGDDVSCSGSVGQAKGHLNCQTNAGLARIYSDVQAAWTVFPGTIVKPAVALDHSTYYQSTDGTVKGVALDATQTKHADGNYYEEYAVKVGSADWKYISADAPINPGGLSATRLCSILTKAEYKDVFASITADNGGCLAGN